VFTKECDLHSYIHGLGTPRYYTLSKTRGKSRVVRRPVYSKCGAVFLRRSDQKLHIFTIRNFHSHQTYSSKVSLAPLCFGRELVHIAQIIREQSFLNVHVAHLHYTRKLRRGGEQHGIESYQQMKPLLQGVRTYCINTTGVSANSGKKWAWYRYAFKKLRWIRSTKELIILPKCTTSLSFKYSEQANNRASTVRLIRV